MVDRIEIIITSGIFIVVEALIEPSQKTMYINSQKKEITPEFVENILSCIYNWKSEYGTAPIIDPEEFNIRVTSGEKVNTYHGKGIYPNNYSDFKKLLNS